MEAIDLSRLEELDLAAEEQTSGGKKTPSTVSTKSQSSSGCDLTSMYIESESEPLLRENPDRFSMFPIRYGSPPSFAS